VFATEPCTDESLDHAQGKEDEHESARKDEMMGKKADKTKPKGEREKNCAVCIGACVPGPVETVAPKQMDIHFGRVFDAS
jgi:hypothetical protein